MVPFGDELGVFVLPPPPDLLHAAVTTASASTVAPRANVRFFRIGFLPSFRSGGARPPGSLGATQNLTSSSVIAGSDLGDRAEGGHWGGPASPGCPPARARGGDPGRRCPLEGAARPPGEDGAV